MTVRIRVPLVLATAIFGVGFVTAVHAADSWLDDAQAHLAKVDALLKAAESSNDRKDYVRHTKRAEDLVRQAAHEIDLAKMAAKAANAAPAGNPGSARTSTFNQGAPARAPDLVHLNPQPEPPAPTSGR